MNLENYELFADILFAKRRQHVSDEIFIVNYSPVSNCSKC